jgi:hypothetical protein
MIANLPSKVLVVSPTLPSGEGVGSHMMRDLIEQVPYVQFDFFPVEYFLFGLEVSHFPRLRAYLFAIFARNTILQSLRLAAFRRFAVNRRAREVKRRAAECGADCIWLVAAGPEVTALGSLLAACGLDLRVMVWDDPEYLANNLRLAKHERDRLIGAFGALLRKARNISVISQAMKTDYWARFGAQCDVIRHGINVDHPAPAKVPSEPIKIAFAGSLYSKAEWNSFVLALASVDWKINEHKITLSFIGRFPLSGALCPPEVTVIGAMSFDDTLAVLTTMDIGYLPYWFSSEYETVARTSFPGKLSAYTAAGLAIFHHAPEYAEVTSFLETYPYGLTCHSQVQERVLQSFRNLVALMGTPGYESARQRAFHAELSARTMGQRFRRFLSNDNSSLRNHSYESS